MLQSIVDSSRRRGRIFRKNGNKKPGEDRTNLKLIESNECHFVFNDYTRANYFLRLTLTLTTNRDRILGENILIARYFCRIKRRVSSWKHLIPKALYTWTREPAWRVCESLFLSFYSRLTRSFSLPPLSRSPLYARVFPSSGGGRERNSGWHVAVFISKSRKGEERVREE